MSDNALTLVARAKDEISGPVTAAAANVEQQFQKIKAAVEDVERAQRAALKDTERARREAQDALHDLTDSELENLERLNGAYDHARDVIGNFEGFIETQFRGAFPGLSLVADAAGEVYARVEQAAEAIYKYTKAAADAGDAAFTAGQRLGVSAAFVSKNSFAAEQAGTSWAEVEKGMAKLAAQVNSGAKIFEELGVSTTDASGKVKPLEDLFYEVADAIAKTENDTLRLARTQEVFGKGARELVPLVAEGRVGLEAFGAEAERLGLVISDKAAAAGDELNDKLALVEATSAATGRVFGELFVPGLEEGAKGMIEINASGTKLVNLLGGEIESAATGAGVLFREFGEGVSWAFEKIDKQSAQINEDMELIGDTVVNTVPIFGGFRMALDLTGEALTWFADGAEDAVEAEKKLGEATELTSAALKEQEERAKQLEKALARAGAIADRAYKKILEDHKREQSKAKKQEDAAEDKEIDAALKRLNKRGAAEKEMRDEELFSEQEAAGVIEQIRNEHEVVRQRAREAREKQEKRHEEDALDRARKSADDIFKEHKKKAELAKKELSEIQDMAVQIASSVLGVFAAAFAGATVGAEDFGDSLDNALGSFFGADRGTGSKSGTNAALGALVGFTGILGRVASASGGGAGAVLGFSEGGLVPQRFAEGGLVTGGTPGRDSVRALLEPGEFVLPKKVVDLVRFGSLNTSGRFASGGYVGPRSGYVSPDELDGLSAGEAETLSGIGSLLGFFGGPLGGLIGGVIKNKAAQGLSERQDAIELARMRRDLGYKFGNVDRYGGRTRAVHRVEPRAFQQIVMLGGGEAGLVKLERDHRSIAQNRIERNQLTQHQDRAADRAWWRERR